MDARFLQQHVQYFASSGTILSSELLAQITNSLTLCKSNNHFNKILFWGQVKGVKESYLICQGISGTDELNGRTTLYSLNGNDWRLLNTPGDAVQSDCMMIRGRFIGDPSYEYEQHEIKRMGTGNNTSEEDAVIHVKEEDRLATIVKCIDDEAMVVPRAAYIRNPAGIVTPNDGFSGLCSEKATNLENWLHFSGPVQLPNKSLLEKADQTAPIDFLRQASDDVPSEGSWSVQSERGPGVDSSLVKLRSLHWMGAEACHVPGTPVFSRCYFGDGQRNINLPFQLPMAKKMTL